MQVILTEQEWLSLKRDAEKAQTGKFTKASECSEKVAKLFMEYYKVNFVPTEYRGEGFKSLSRAVCSTIDSYA